MTILMCVVYFIIRSKSLDISLMLKYCHFGPRIQFLFLFFTILKWLDKWESLHKIGRSNNKKWKGGMQASEWHPVIRVNPEVFNHLLLTLLSHLFLASITANMWNYMCYSVRVNFCGELWGLRRSIRWQTGRLVTLLQLFNNRHDQVNTPAITLTPGICIKRKKDPCWSNKRFVPLL